MTTLPYRDYGYIRFISDRTGEALFEIKMIHGHAIVWGSHDRPSEFDLSVADDRRTMSIEGTLRDRLGLVVTFGACLDIQSGFRVELGSLREDYDPSWSRDNT